MRGLPESESTPGPDSAPCSPVGGGDPQAVFAYGSLRVGESNHEPYLAGRFTRVTPAWLPDYATCVGPEGFLVAWPQPGGRLRGELFDLSVPLAAETLARLDELEGVPPGSTRGPEYERQLCVVVTDAGPRRAWVYTGPRTAASPG